MLKMFIQSFIAAGVLFLFCVPGARAQFAVIDVGAIAQLVQQVADLEQQIEVARNQLLQAQQTYAAMTGDRGMERLLSGTTRNYLPTSWAELTSAMQGNGVAYSQLAGDVRSAVTANAVLPPARLATLAQAQQRQISSERSAAALQQALSQEALANSSGRFASLQTLISAISSAADQKAILDLQSRIMAEVSMLQDEQTKLQVLYQATQAQNAIDVQRGREQVIAGHGLFATRFQPVP